MTDSEGVNAFCRRMGNLDTGNMSRYMRAKTMPSSDTLKLIASAAGVSIDWLLTGERPTPFADVGARLVWERARLGMSVQYMAQAGGVTVEEQKAFERGEARTPADYLNRLVPHGVETHWILFGGDELDAERDKTPMPYTAVIRDFIKDYELCSPEVQASLRTLAKQSADARRAYITKKSKAAPTKKDTESKP